MSPAKDPNNRQRQRLSHMQNPQPALRLSSLPSHLLSQLAAQPGLTPQQVLGRETTGVYLQHKITISTLSVMFSTEHLVIVHTFSLYWRMVSVRIANVIVLNMQLHSWKTFHYDSIWHQRCVGLFKSC